MLTVLCAAAVAGCGGGEGAEAGASVRVYVDAGLCAAAKAELAAAGGGAGDLRVGAVCLPSARRGGGVDLAAAGANARRATEDSTAVAYLLPSNRTITDFTTPILAAAGIPSITTSSGKAAMARTLQAIESANPNTLRSSVSDSLGRP